ncbi:hypothetical protein ERX27_09880 [Macrococcus brunensis]|uniref:Uncharacterized protein n=1 Tax=Macrococcus brunensis TaxID=198483 RepID=A0A4V3BD43_9STAP|nr:hypothetical protein [Macrococcus brunensis]TDL94176.1 hypothetical protein ERX27_09880 [Macrococcus brunensis]
MNIERYILFREGLVYPGLLIRIVEAINNTEETLENIDDCIYIQQILKYIKWLSTNKEVSEKMLNESGLTKELLDEGEKILQKRINIYLNTIKLADIQVFLNSDSIYDFKLFLDLIKDYKKTNLINQETFNQILDARKVHLYDILKTNWFVDEHKEIIKHELINSKQAANILIKANYKNKNTENVKKLEVDDETFSQIIEKYIDELNIIDSDLNILSDSKGALFQISPALKLKAKKKYDELTKKLLNKHSPAGLEFGVKIKQNKEQILPITYSQDGHYLVMNINSSIWATDNDELLNYFYYNTFIFNGYGVLNITNKENGALASLFSMDYDKFYEMDTVQRSYFMYDQSFLYVMNEFLEHNNKTVLDLIQHFINDILVKDYKIENIKFTLPKSEDQNEINRDLSLKIETLLKYYQYYVEYGYVNTDEIKMGYSLPKIKDLKSQSKMYIKIKNDFNINKICQLLYNDQSPLYIYSVTELQTKGCFYLQFENNSLEINDKLKDNELVMFLLEQNILKEENDTLKFIDFNIISVLYHLYNKHYMNFYYLNGSVQNEINKLIELGYVEWENGLFTTEESNIVSFLLNNELYENAVAVRNKYAHPETLDEYTGKEVYEDFITILQLYIYIIMKINDDCRITQFLNKENQ